MKYINKFQLDRNYIYKYILQLLVTVTLFNFSSSLSAQKRPVIAKPLVVKPEVDIKWMNSNDSVYVKNKFYNNNLPDAGICGLYSKKEYGEVQFILLQKSEYVIKRERIGNDSLLIFVKVIGIGNYKVSKFTIIIQDENSAQNEVFFEDIIGDAVPKRIMEKIKKSNNGTLIKIIATAYMDNGVERNCLGTFLSYRILSLK